MSGLIIRDAKIDVIDNHPRLSSVPIAKAMGLSNKEFCTELVKQHEKELLSYGEIVKQVHYRKGKKHYHLMLLEDQCLVLLSVVRVTPQSAELKYALIKLFIAYRNTVERGAPPPPPQGQRDISSKAVAAINALNDEVAAHEHRLNTLEDVHDGWLAVLGWCKRNKVNLLPGEDSYFGTRLSEYCRNNGIAIIKISHPWCGYVGTYPPEAFEACLPEFKKWVANNRVKRQPYSNRLPNGNTVNIIIQQ